MTRSVLWTLAAWCSLGGAAAHSDVPIAIAYPEYLAVYSLTEEGSHILSILDGGDEAFNETSLEFMVVPSSSADLEGLEEAEAASASAWEQYVSGLLEPTTILDESSIVPSRAIVYTVSLLSTSRTSDSDNSNNSNSTQEAFAVLPISITASGAYTILLSHTVEEVPLTIESPSGEALTPIVSETDHAHEDSEAHAEEEDTEAAEEEEDGDGENRNGTAAQWANALAASFIISLCSFVGVITVVSSRVAEKINLPLAFLFASGALLTTAIVHIIPEAMNDLEGEFEDDLHNLTLHSGIVIMAGVTGGYLLHVAIGNGHHRSHSQFPVGAAGTGPDRSEEEESVETASASAADGDATGIKRKSLGKAMSNHSNKAFSSPPSSSPYHKGGARATGLAPATTCDESRGAIGGAGGGEPSAADVRNGGQEALAGENSGVLLRARDAEEGLRDCVSEAENIGTPEKTANKGSHVYSADTTGAREMRESPAHLTGARALATDAGTGGFALSLKDLQNSGNNRGILDIKGLDPVCWNVIVGDLAHNFADGVTMGAAFLGCSPTVGWTVTAANMMHEIPHEVANFMALVNGGMTVIQALFYNFLSAIFAVLGVVITMSLSGLITETTIAYLLLLGAGTFVFVGLSELIPGALDAEFTNTSRRGTQIKKVSAFALGALLLGLPLLVHQHCGAEHGHDHHR